MQIENITPQGQRHEYFTVPTVQNRACSKPKRTFLLILFPTILLVFGKVNFTNLSRYSDICEKTYRHYYAQPFNFPALNAHLIAAAIPATRPQIAAIDCSFIPKSGKKTYGVDWFYNGSASRTEKGLEISVIAVIDVHAHQGYTLSVQQTPPQNPKPAILHQGIDCVL